MFYRWITQVCFILDLFYSGVHLFWADVTHNRGPLQNKPAALLFGFYIKSLPWSHSNPHANKHLPIIQFHHTMYKTPNARGPTPLYTPQPTTGTKFDPRVFPSAQPYPIVQQYSVVGVNRRPAWLRFLRAFAVAALVWFSCSTFLRTWLPRIHYRPLVSWCILLCFDVFIIL